MKTKTAVRQEPKKLRPLSPLQAQKQLLALDDLYETYGQVSPEARDKIRMAILDRMMEGI